MGNRLIRELVNQFNKILNGSLKSGLSNGETKNQHTSTPKLSRILSNAQVKDAKTSVPLYVITPTFRRPEQIPELTRMAHTLMLVENVHWLVIEDAKILTPQVSQLLNRTGLVFEHLIGKKTLVFRNVLVAMEKKEKSTISTKIRQAVENNSATQE